MKYSELSPRDNDTGEFPTLGITFRFNERGLVEVCYPAALAFSKRKGPGTRKGSQRFARAERREAED